MLLKCCILHRNFYKKKSCHRFLCIGWQTYGNILFTYNKIIINILYMHNALIVFCYITLYAKYHVEIYWNFANPAKQGGAEWVVIVYLRYFNRIYIRLYTCSDISDDFSGSVLGESFNINIPPCYNVHRYEFYEIRTLRYIICTEQRLQWPSTIFPQIYQASEFQKVFTIEMFDHQRSL